MTTIPYIHHHESERLRPLIGTYSGTVVSINDPKQQGRIQVRVPHVYGPTPGGQVPDAQLPWAMPSSLPSGQTNESGGLSHLPNPGDRVFVRFLDGEPEKPTWEWAMQDSAGLQTLALNTYSGSATPGQMAATSSAAANTSASVQSASTTGAYSSAGNTGAPPSTASMVASGAAYNMNVRSTSYVANEAVSDPNTNAGQSFTGVPLQTATATQVGVCSVDPAVIPYGSQVIVQTANGPLTYVAADTGSGVVARTASGGTSPVIDFYSGSNGKLQQVGGEYQTVTVVPYSGTNFNGLSAANKAAYVSSLSPGTGTTNANPSLAAAAPTSANGTPAATTPTQSAAPARRSAMTRFSHILEFTPTQVLYSTGHGYSLTHVDSSTSTSKDGYLSWKTPGGNFIEVYDDASGGDHIDVFSNNHWNGTFQALYFTGSTYEFYGRSTWKQEITGNITVTGKSDYTRQITGDFTGNTHGSEVRTVDENSTLTVTGSLSETADSWRMAAQTINTTSMMTTIAGTASVVLTGGGHTLTVSSAGISFT